MGLAGELIPLAGLDCWWDAELGLRAVIVQLL